MPGESVSSGKLHQAAAFISAAVELCPDAAAGKKFEAEVFMELLTTFGLEAAVSILDVLRVIKTTKERLGLPLTEIAL